MPVAMSAYRRKNPSLVFSGDNFATHVVATEGFWVRFVADGFNDRLSALDFADHDPVLRSRSQAIAPSPAP